MKTSPQVENVMVCFGLDVSVSVSCLVFSRQPNGGSRSYYLGFPLYIDVYL